MKSLFRKKIIILFLLLILSVLFTVFFAGKKIFFGSVSREPVSPLAKEECAEQPYDTAVTGEKQPEYVGPFLEPLKIDSKGNLVGFSWMDEDEDENLIIKSNCRTYTSFSSSLIYFAVSQKDGKEEDFDMQFYLPQNIASALGGKVEIKAVEKQVGETWQVLPITNKEIKSEKRFEKAFEKRKSVPAELEAKSKISFKLETDETAYFRAEIVYPPGSEGQFMIEAFGDQGSYGLLDPWFSSLWTHRKKIIINEGKVSGSSNLTNFPMLINSTDLDFRTVANGGKVGKSDGTDILFTSSDGTTQLDHELEKYTATTGELIAWVEIPTLDYDDNTVIYMYYGNAAAADQQDITGTWDANYKGVLHLDEGYSTAASFYKDSTSNAYNGTLVDADADTASATGKIDGALNFNGDADYIELGNISPVVSSFTLSSWVVIDTTPADRYRIIDRHHDSAGGNTFATGLLSSRKAHVAYAASGGEFNLDGNTVIPFATMTHVAVTRNGANVKVYVNGNLDSSSSSGTTGDISYDGTSVTIADQSNNAGSRKWDGILDEVRVSSTDRSADWIATEYNNQSSPSAFYVLDGQDVEIRSGAGVTVGATSTGGTFATWFTTGGTRTHRKKITINHPKVSGSSNLTNFPVLVSRTDTDWKDTGNGGKVGKSDGTDILFTSSDGTTQLDHELEKYTATTGELIAWVEIPTLDYDDNTVIYMYYGNAAAADQQDITGTWDA